MNKKTLLSTAIGLVMGGASMAANANLTSSSTLSFTLGAPGVVDCVYATSSPPCNGMVAKQITDIVGSYFSMDTNGNSVVQVGEKTPISSFNGIHIGTTQAATGSHSNIINGSEAPNIDNPWTFFGNTGMHQTVGTAATVVSSSANGAVIDLSGWSVAWNGIPDIDMVALGNATMVCTTGSSCSDTSSYTLDAAFHVNGAKFTSVGYTLHLTGTVANAAVPVPAAAWLFGSGLVGLAGIARRRKTK